MIPSLSDFLQLKQSLIELFEGVTLESRFTRWTPSALTIASEVPVSIMGLVENRQAIFEDETLCQEALLWSLLAVARIGQARGDHELSGFMFHWTGNYGLTLDMITSQLGIP